MNDVEKIYITAFAVIVGFAVLVGLIRGAKRSLYRLIMVGIAFGISVIALPWVFQRLMTFDVAKIADVKVDGETLHTLEAFIANYMDKLIGKYIDVSQLGATKELIEALPKMLLGFIVFEVVFGLVNFILWIFYSVTVGFVDGKKKTGKKRRHKLVGALIGAVNGVLIAFIALNPALGLAHVAEPFVHDENIKAELMKSDAGQYYKYIDDFVSYDGLIKKILGYQGIDIKFFEKISETEINGQKVGIEDIRGFSGIVGDAFGLYDAFKKYEKDYLKLFNEENEADLQAVVDYCKKIISFLTAENGITKTLLGDAAKYGMNNVDALIKDIPEAEYRDFAKTAIQVFFDYDGGVGGAVLPAESVGKALNSLLDLAYGLRFEIRALGTVYTKETDTDYADLLLAYRAFESIVVKAFNDIGIMGTLVQKGIEQIQESTELWSKLIGVSNITGASREVLEELHELLFGTGKEYSQIKANIFTLMSFGFDGVLVIEKMNNVDVSDLSTLVALFDEDKLGGLIAKHFSESSIVKDILAVVVNKMIADEKPGEVTVIGTVKPLLIDYIDLLAEMTSEDILKEFKSLQAGLTLVGDGDLLNATDYRAVLELLEGVLSFETVADRVITSMVAGTLTGIKLSIKDNDIWTAEEGAKLYGLIAELVKISDEGSPAVEDLMPLGALLDGLKDCKIIGGKDGYNTIVGKLIGLALDDQARGELGIDENTDYFEIKWQELFSLAYVGSTLADLAKDGDTFVDMVKNMTKDGVIDDEDQAKLKDILENAFGEDPNEAVAAIQTALTHPVISEAIGKAIEDVKAQSGGGDLELEQDEVIEWVFAWLSSVLNS